MVRTNRGKGPTSKQRLQVWRGELAKTTGGLTKKDLIKNKRGKIVSRKKSTQAATANNLGSWLRAAGKSVPKDKLLRRRGDLDEEAKPAAAPPKKPAPKAPAPKKPKQAKKPPAPKKVAQKKPVAKKKAAPVKKKPKKAVQKNINPLTGEAKNMSGLGFSAGGNVDTDNIITGKRRRKRVSYKY